MLPYLHMKKLLVLLLIITAAAIAVGTWNWRIPALPGTIPETPPIGVITPTSNSVVQSPLSITGRARGNWFFEASFPVKIVDKQGNMLSQTIATAQGDWMTTEFVPFTATAFFTVTTSTPADLVLQKDNPSGLPQFDDELRIPITLQPTTAAQRTVQLYYYNPTNDREPNGNLMCSRQGLQSVSRNIPLTNTPIQDAIKLLLKGQLTLEEKNTLTTEFPLPGFELKSASSNNGVLTLTFADPQHKTGGGSCRVGILWMQIEATAKQFPGVTSVQYAPEDLFQP